MAKRLQYRYYGVFAVNPKDPSDFYGYCENSFSMGWYRDHVCIWQARSSAQYLKQNDCHSHHPSQRQFDWNWAKNYTKSIPQGYVLKTYRLNSKSCPYKVDFGYRWNWTRENHNKWLYRNPKCKFNASFGSDDWKEWINDSHHEYDGKLDDVKYLVDMDKVSKQDLRAYESLKNKMKMKKTR